MREETPKPDESGAESSGSMRRTGAKAASSAAAWVAATTKRVVAATAGGVASAAKRGAAAAAWLGRVLKRALVATARGTATAAKHVAAALAWLARGLRRALAATARGVATAAKHVAAAIQVRVKGLDGKDTSILLGSLALFVLYFLPWYTSSMEVAGKVQSDSIHGFHGISWLGWIAAGTAVLLMVSKTRILGDLPPSWATLARNGGILVIVTGVAVLAGPLYFWSRIAGDLPSAAGPLGEIDATKTLAFALALLGAFVALGGAVWKLATQEQAERKPR